jgi:hypothetical protein
MKMEMDLEMDLEMDVEMDQVTFSDAFKAKRYGWLSEKIPALCKVPHYARVDFATIKTYTHTRRNKCLR